MPYKKVIDGENISYIIRDGALKIWLEKIQEILELDGSEPQLNYYLCIAALSMGEQARIKWDKQHFSKDKAKNIELLLAQLREDQIFFLDVIDYIANSMPIAEMEQMKDRIISDVTEYFPAEHEEHNQTSVSLVATSGMPASPLGVGAGFLPHAEESEESPVAETEEEAVDWASLTPDELWDRLATHVEHHYTYPYDRFPTMSYLEYDNSVFLHIETLPNGVIFSMLPGKVTTTNSNQAHSSVFLSHSHRDKDFARKLAKDLQISRIKVWIDEAEIKIGDSLISKMESGVEDMEYLGVILSPSSVESPWVTEELNAAMHLGKNKGRVKVLPILYQPCKLPTFLLDKKYVDFSDPAKYKISLDSLVNNLLGLSPCVLLTAKEAAQFIKTRYNPLGSLCGISQQGICQQYIPNQIQIRGDWYYADVKTGRSTVWVLEYYDKSTKGYSSYHVTDGIAEELLSTAVLDNGVKPLNFNFIDSDIAVSAAIERANSVKAIPADENSYFVNSLLKFCLLLEDYVWFVLFFDITLAEVTFIVEVNSHTGTVLDDQATIVQAGMALPPDDPRKNVLASTAHPHANPDRAAQLNIQYQKDLKRWQELSWWQRRKIKKPTPPSSI